MKKTFLLSALLIFACSSDDNNDNNSDETFLERYDKVKWNFEQQGLDAYKNLIFFNQYDGIEISEGCNLGSKGYIAYGSNEDNNENFPNNHCYSAFYENNGEFKCGGGGWTGNSPVAILVAMIANDNYPSPRIILNSGNTLQIEVRNYPTNTLLEIVTIQANDSEDEILITSTNFERIPEIGFRSELVNEEQSYCYSQHYN